MSGHVCTEACAHTIDVGHDRSTHSHLRDEIATVVAAVANEHRGRWAGAGTHRGMRRSCSCGAEFLGMAEQETHTARIVANRVVHTLVLHGVLPETERTAS